MVNRVLNPCNLISEILVSASIWRCLPLWIMVYLREWQVGLIYSSWRFLQSNMKSDTWNIKVIHESEIHTHTHTYIETLTHRRIHLQLLLLMLSVFATFIFSAKMFFTGHNPHLIKSCLCFTFLKPQITFKHSNSTPVFWLLRKLSQYEMCLNLSSLWRMKVSDIQHLLRPYSISGIVINVLQTLIKSYQEI